MITIFNEQDARNITDPELLELVQGHLITAKENGLEDLTVIAVIEPADSEQTFIDELGFSPLQNPLTETRFGDPDFIPAWDWLEVHPGWYELIFTVGDDGFAYILLVPSEAKESDLTRLCERYGGRGRFLKT